MTFGSHRFGSPHFTQMVVTGLVPPFSAFVRMLSDAHPDIYTKAPFLVFYDLSVTTGTVRVVDFADPEVSVSPGLVRFDGNDYNPVKIGQPKLKESSDGSFQFISMDIQDPLRVVLSFVRANNNLVGGTVTLRIIRFDDIPTPSKAKSKTFSIREVDSLEGPARVQVTFGPPDLQGIKFPTVEFSRFICPNAYERRHVHDGLSNCTHPSDDFQEKTEQIFPGSVDTELEADHGWFIINGTKVVSGTGVARTNQLDDALIPTTNRVFRLAGDTGDTDEWDDTNKQSAFVYRKILDNVKGDPGFDTLISESDPDFDAITKINGVVAGAPMSFVGMLIQFDVLQDNWIFWGLREVTANNYEQYARVTTGGTSVDNNFTGEPNAFRIERTGTSFKLYSRTEADDRFPLSPPAWALKQTSTLAGTGTIRVGMVAFTNGVASQAEADFYHFRFLKGGFKICDRSNTHCTERKNLIERNSYDSLPDAIVLI